MMISGNTEPTAVGKVEIPKPVLEIASCRLCNDAFNEQKRYVNRSFKLWVTTSFYLDPLSLQVNVT